MRRVFAVLTAAAVAGAAAWVRHGFIESESLAPLCLESVPPWWCAIRSVLESAGRSSGLAGAAVAVALAALRWRRLAGWGMGLGGVALAFGNLGLGGPAIVLGLLGLVRRQQQGQGEQA
jgi:hypothetical protein